jgi:hypothetical protein
MERPEADSTDTREKIVLPEALQRAMIIFFRETAARKHRGNKNSTTSPNPNITEGE